MAPHPLRDGVREVLRDPALLLIEIGWRWSFGAIAILVLWLSVFAVLGSVPVGSRFPSTSTVVSVWETARSLANTLITVGCALTRVGIAASLFLALCWIVLNSLGRHAALSRPALTPGASLRSCIAISVARAGITFAAVLAWIVVGGFGAFLAAKVSGGGVPNLGLMLLVLVPALILIVGAWATLNWYLSLAPILATSVKGKLVPRLWEFAREGRDSVLEISLVSGVIRAGFFLVALMLSFAVAVLVSNPRLLAADLIAISVLYFLCADFVYVARLCAYAKLRAKIGPATLGPIFTTAESTAPPGSTSSPLTN